MTAKNRLVLIPLLVRAKFALACFTLILAHVASDALAAVAKQEALSTNLADLTLLTWFFLTLFSVLGWIVADLDKVADLWDQAGKSASEIIRERLKLCKGLAASIVAGFCIYFIGKNAPDFILRMLNMDAGAELPEMILFVFVTMGGYLGTRFFAWLERKYFS